MLALLINHVCYPRTLPPQGYADWWDWQYGRAGVDTDYWDRNTCQYEVATTSPPRDAVPSTVPPTDTATDTASHVPITDTLTATSTDIASEAILVPITDTLTATSTDIASEAILVPITDTLTATSTDIPWELIAVILGCVAVAVGILATLYKCCKKERSDSSSCTIDDSSINDNAEYVINCEIN